MRVAGEGTFGVSEVLASLSQLPLDDGLVSGGREDHVWYLRGGGNLGDPPIVAL